MEYVARNRQTNLAMVSKLYYFRYDWSRYCVGKLSLELVWKAHLDSRMLPIAINVMVCCIPSTILYALCHSMECSGVGRAPARDSFCLS